jgi:F-type H+-transporting ATPase subunit delta
MAELATLARPYSSAVFELAKSTDSFDEWSEHLKFLTNVVSDPGLAEVVANPRVDRNTLKRILLDLSEGHSSDLGKNLIKLLIDNNRLSAIPQIAVQYEQLKARHQGYVKVEIISTYAVKPPQQQEIEAILRKRLGRAVNVNITIDRSLMGGWLIKVGDQVIDLSVKGRLRQLASACEIVCRSV